MVRELFVDEATEPKVGKRHVEMFGPNDPWHPGHTRRQTDNPPVARTVGIDQVRAESAERIGSADNRPRHPRSRSGKGVCFKSPLDGTGVNSARARREQRDGASALLEAGHFGQDARFLAAPAARAFGMHDAPGGVWDLSHWISGDDCLSALP